MLPGFVNGHHHIGVTPVQAFDMNCVGHIQHGMWTHPRDRSTEYNTIQYWQDLARLAERGKFDGIFLADIVGVYDVYRGGRAALSVSLRSSAPRGSVNCPRIISSPSGRLPTTQQYSSERPLGSLK
jgi:hypothetical protein